MRVVRVQASILAEVGTVQLEFRYLSKHTGKPQYGEAAENAIKVLKKHQKANGLYPIYISPQTGAVRAGALVLQASLCWGSCTHC